MEKKKKIKKRDLPHHLAPKVNIEVNYVRRVALVYFATRSVKSTRNLQPKEANDTCRKIKFQELH